MLVAVAGTLTHVSARWLLDDRTQSMSLSAYHQAAADLRRSCAGPTACSGQPPRQTLPFEPVSTTPAQSAEVAEPAQRATELARHAHDTGHIDSTVCMSAPCHQQRGVAGHQL